MRTIEEYRALIEQVAALGKELLEQEEEKDNPAWWYEEVECMDMHFEACEDNLARIDK